MPLHLIPSSLYSISSQEVANIFLAGCKSLDSKLQKPLYQDRHSSPQKVQVSSDHKSPDREEVYLHLSPEHRVVLDWLSNLPDRVIEDVVRNFLAKLETDLLEDMDNKVILTLINIEKMKMNDFFFWCSLLNGCSSRLPTKLPSLHEASLARLVAVRGDHQHQAYFIHSLLKPARPLVPHKSNYSSCGR